MKPKKLKMTAFGPFSKETVVDFDRFENGIFLITGDTGAGKTTIFDALVFALYGELSGSDRDIKMMHSDFLANKVDTVVELLFEHAGEEYTVERTFHNAIKQGTKDEISKSEKKATLKKPDDKVVEGASKVTGEIEELLGMDKDQFCQIVMLAQGEFKKFLKADSVKRSEILGRLFDNSNILRYQELIKNASDKVEKAREENVKNIEAFMNKSFVFPEEEAGFDPEMWLPGNPNLLDDLQRLIDYENEIIAKEDNLRKEADGKLEELNRQHGTIESRNKLLEELDEKRDHLVNLKTKENEYGELKKKCDVVEKAFHKVLPAVENDRKVKGQVQKQREKITDLSEQLVGVQNKKKEIDEIVQKDVQNQETIESLTVEIQSVTDSLEKYRKFSALKKKISERKDKIDDDKKNLENSKKEYDELEKKLKEYQEEQSSLDNVDATLVKVDEKLKNKNELKKQIVGDDGLLNILSNISKDESELNNKEEAYRQFVDRVLQLKDDYDKKYSRFLEGQSGILAEQIRKDLEENGEALCPVCRTHFVKGDTYHFSELEKDVPKQSEVDEAKAKFDKNEKERAEKQSENESLKVKIDENKKNALAIGQRLFDDCVDWDVLSRESYLADKLSKLDDELDKLAKESVELKTKQNRLTELKQLIEKGNKDKGDLVSSNSSLSTSIEKESKELDSWKEECEVLKNSLKYESEEAANAIISNLNKQKTDLSELVKLHNQENEKIQRQFSGLTGELKTAKDNLEDLEKQSKEAEEKVKEILSEVSFGSVEEAEAALADISDPEKWLQVNEKEYRDYENALKNTGDRVHELEDQTKDWIKQDIEEINNKIEAQKQQCDEINEQLNGHKNLKDNHDKVFSAVKEEKGALADTDYMSGMLRKLSSIANGSSGEGGKLSFYRYVLGLRFKEIIERANVRLDIISGGRYQLVHTTTVDRENGVAGLGIDIFDGKTKKQRDSASLSGGESFVVSMSLALGLSDVVQSYSRGMSLNTLFIDEGFGTLDDDVLDKVISVLQNLSGNDTEGNDSDAHKNRRLVGVISHVSQLEAVLPKIVVKSGADGSTVH